MCRPGRGTAVKMALGLLLAMVLVVGGVAFLSNPDLQALVQPAEIRDRVRSLGGWGPAALMAGMALAIVFSPVPSAPITLAAGAVYGHLWGTLYALVGAHAGAMIAFAIARLFGRAAVVRFVPASLLDSQAGIGRSQWVLAGGVVVARLFPFVSFDAVSYLAGLTPLRTWLFAVATLIGMVPMTFLFAHLGGTMTSGEEAIRALNLLALVALAGFVLIGWRLRGRRGS